MYGQGISRVGEVLDLAVELNIIQKGGAWFSYNDMKLGQGRDNAKEFLKNNLDIMAEVEKKIKENAGDIVLVSKKNKKAAAKAGAEKSYDEDVSAKVDPEEDFEEFTPSEE